MSINVTVVGTTNVVASVAETTIGVSVGSPGSVDVGIGTMVAQAVTGLLVAGGKNVTVTTTSGVFTIAAADAPVSSVNGKTGAVVLNATDVGAASNTHGHSYVQSLNSLTGTLNVLAGSNITISTSSSGITIVGSAGGGTTGGAVSSVNGRTGTVTLVASDVSAASASHTHVVANITDFAAGVRSNQSVSSVNGRTGTVTLVASDVSAASASHTHVVANITDFATGVRSNQSVSSVNGRTGTVTLVASDVSAASASHTHVAANITDFTTEAAKVGPVSSVNGRTGTVTLVASDVSAASVTHAHSYVQSLNSQTGSLSIVAGDNVTISTSAGFITITGAAAGTAGSSVTSVNGKSGQVTIGASDVTAAGAYIWGTIEATANLNNHSPGTATVLRISANTANRSITGFSGGGENKVLRLINVATNILTLVHNSTASDSSNRLLLDTGTNRTLDENDQAELLYDPVSMRWRVTPCCGVSS